MDPINGDISEKYSQNPDVLEAKDKVETSTASVELNTITNDEIKTNDEKKTNDETKNKDIAEKSEDTNEVNKEPSTENQEKTTKDDKESLKKNEMITEGSNTEQTTNVLKERLTNAEKNHKNDEDSTSIPCKNQKNNGNDDSLKAKESENLHNKKVSNNGEIDTSTENEIQTNSKDLTVEDEDNTKSDIYRKDSKEQPTNKSNLLAEDDKQQDGGNQEIENESESEKADETEEEYEDVEIPEEEEEDVEELIVPDEADAEDLTSLNGDNLDKSINEDETTKYSDADDQDENETSVNETGIVNKSLNDEAEDLSKDTEENENENTVGNFNKSLNDEEEDLTKDTEDENIAENCSKSLNEDEEDLSKDSEEAEIDNITTEPELVAIDAAAKEKASMTEDSTNDNDDNEDVANNTTNDPLNCIDHHEQQDECDNDDANKTPLENISAGEDEDDNDIVDADDDDDEDDVQFVETRNSPICIESDEDDADDSNDKSEMMHNTSITRNPKTQKQTITTPTATITIPRNIIVTRTSARKSTAKPPNQPVAKATSNSSKTVPQIQNKPKNFNYLEKATNNRRSRASSSQKVIDCIELLDSSDEESPSASHYRPTAAQQSRTPQKRTLLAAKGTFNKNSNKNVNGRGHLPSNFSPQIRKQAKKPAPPPLPPATPQSNFLNAVQLQPAAVTGANPPAFSALLSNKSVIIPNAFYGNHPSVRGTADIDLDRRYARWLENFLTQFCNPQLVATHSCFVFLQRALKYKDFARIKAIRANLNTHAQNAKEQLHTNLMTDLRTILLKNPREVTTHGRRFCELTCNSPIQGKAVTLLAHGLSGRVTMKTCHMDIPKASLTSSTSSTSSAAANSSLTRKRQVEEDEDEYMPDKQKLKTITQYKSQSENDDSGETSEDRKRSLRTKRTKRLDNSFSYNEDDLLAEYEIDDEEEVAEKLAIAEVQRKIEKKRLEAQKQRQKQVKSFESAFIQAFAKSLDEPSASSSKNTKNASNQRIRFKNSTTVTASSVQQYTANNDAEDLFTATWIENAENEDAQIISDDDEPKVHRIYKKQQKQQLQQQCLPTTKSPTKFNATPSPKPGKHHKRQQQQEEIITGDDDYIENDQFYNNPTDIDASYWPKNVDPQMHVSGKFKDRCVICNLNCQRIVHHYVNEHRGCEVYNSRLTSSQIHLLKHGNCSESSMSVYKNGQAQYEAYCIFCQKQSRFMLPYWFQHFTMHTGEYAYRCTGCGIRKPTRSLLTQHQAQGCPLDGSTIQDYSHDAKSLQVEARVCTLCNYVQLHRTNIVKHLHQQHNIRQILPKHIQTIVLLKTTSSSSPSTTSLDISMKRTRKLPALYTQASSSSSSSSAHNTYIIEDDGNDFVMEREEQPSWPPTEDTQNHYYNYIPPYMQAQNAAANANFTWEDNNDPGEDLSFMICGMLDVQMNTE